MTAAAIIADVRRAIALLVEFGDPAATRTAEALTRWLAGEDFDSAAGVAPGWRAEVERAARHAALSALAAQGFDARAIARGIARASRTRIRPDGVDGVLWDLSRVGAQLSEGHLRRLLAQEREHCKGSNAQGAVQPSPAQLED
ncbi:MAG: hypothetical protein WAU56_07495 [Steroidobacteraceae bacterium]